MPDKMQREIQQASNSELEAMLAASNHDSPKWRCIYDEIHHRKIIQIGKVHWSQHVSWVAAVVAAIASIAGVLLALNSNHEPQTQNTQQDNPQEQHQQIKQ